jgi:hypothetical protein
MYAVSNIVADVVSSFILMEMNGYVAAGTSSIKAVMLKNSE